MDGKSPEEKLPGVEEPAQAKDAGQTVAGPLGDKQSLRDTHAHFMLVDIASPVKEIRGVPRFFPMKESTILIGRYEKAHIQLDDPGTVQLRHARIDLQELDGRLVFLLRPIEIARVSVNGKDVNSAGIALKSEDRIQIGSAKLIFFRTE